MTLSAERKRELEAKLREFVGQPAGPKHTGRDAVNEPMIRQWCDAMGDANPIHLDPAAAKRTRHGGLVAPPTMMHAWTMLGFEMAKGYDEPTNSEQALHKLLTDSGYVGVVGTNTAQGYTRYLRPGDSVSAETVIESISEEKSTALGLGYFIVTRTTFRDQHDEEVGWMSFRVLKYVPAQPAQPSAEPSSGAPAKPGRIRPPLGHDNAGWWERVEAGEIPIQRCNACGALQHPPRPICSACREMDLGFVPASGRGTLHSFTVLHHPKVPGYDYPLVAVLVDLEEGTRLVSSLVDCDPGDVRIGMPVEGFVHEEGDGMKLPLFRPAGA